MGKHGFLTPKAIANRIKAKGLQKLRWYCQMCQKQCRDENGFKCHTMSESHQRQLLLFAENPEKYIDTFSQEFLDDFMQLVKRRFGTRRVRANKAYQEYISDRNHLHMNSTQWETLTDFVKWLGREGHCTVDQTEEGWFLAYIDRDPETIRRQEALMKSEKMKLDDEERMAVLFQRQMEKDKKNSKQLPDSVFTELKKENEEEKVAFSLKGTIKTKTVDSKQNPLSASKNPLELPKNPQPSTSKTTDTSSGKRKMALEEIIDQEKRLHEKKSRKDYWLAEGIDVKVKTKNLGKDVINKKAVVKEVRDKYEAVIKFHDTRENTIAHQQDLQTVIPSIGRQVLILNGVYRGCEATLLDVKYDQFCAKLKITSGTFKSKVIDSIKYEDFSKLHKQL